LLVAIAMAEAFCLALGLGLAAVITSIWIHTALFSLFGALLEFYKIEFLTFKC